MGRWQTPAREGNPRCRDEGYLDRYGKPATCGRFLEYTLQWSDRSASYVQALDDSTVIRTLATDEIIWTKEAHPTGPPSPVTCTIGGDTGDPFAADLIKLCAKDANKYGFFDADGVKGKLATGSTGADKDSVMDIVLGDESLFLVCNGNKMFITKRARTLAEKLEEGQVEPVVIGTSSPLPLSHELQAALREQLVLLPASKRKMVEIMKCLWRREAFVPADDTEAEQLKKALESIFRGDGKVIARTCLPSYDIVDELIAQGILVDSVEGGIVGVGVSPNIRQLLDDLPAPPRTKGGKDPGTRSKSKAKAKTKGNVGVGDKRDGEALQ